MAAARDDRGPRVIVADERGKYIVRRHFKTANALYAYLDKVLGADAARTLFDSEGVEVRREDDDFHQVARDDEVLYLSVDSIPARGGAGGSRGGEERRKPTLADAIAYHFKSGGRNLVEDVASGKVVMPRAKRERKSTSPRSVSHLKKNG
uniref:Uncharacterized protein n=1 Tax=Bicosoecida sp. CB-2014 TaxID=1486930 RepID=A0A7S1CJA2_9STRA